jgi:hypothetical protein
MLLCFFLGKKLLDWANSLRRQKLHFVIRHFIVPSVAIARCSECPSPPYRQELGKAVHR